MPSTAASPLKGSAPAVGQAWKKGLGRWAGVFVLVGIAIVRALTAPRPSPLPPCTEEDRHAMFEAVVSKEPEMRRKAAKDFPTEPWSADDDFHSYELQEATAYAHVHRFRYQDVLAALDDGMRSGWTTKSGVVPKPTVVPCQPRAIY